MKLVELRKIGTTGERQIRECCHSSFSKESILGSYCRKHGPLTLLRIAEGLFTGQIARPITCQVSSFPLSLSRVSLVCVHFQVPLASLTTGKCMNQRHSNKLLSRLVGSCECGRKWKKKKEKL